MTVNGESQTTDSSGSSGQESNSPVVDYSQILQQHRDEIVRTKDQASALERELKDTRSTVDKVRKAFSNEQEEKLTPAQQRMQRFQELQNYLQEEALANKAAGGGGFPVTTKIGLELAEFGRQAVEENQNLRQELDELKQKVDRQQNPAWQGLERMAQAGEGMIQDALEQMYGTGKDTESIRAAQFNAVTARINEEIKDLLKNEPQTLAKIQRDPKKIRSMVNHFMAEMLPPKVRQMMDEQRIQNEEIPVTDLYQALQEAKEGMEEAQKAGDEKAEAHYSGLFTQIRRDILGHQLGSRRGGTPDKPTLNRLMSSFGGGR